MRSKNLLWQNGDNMSRQVAESGRPIIHTDLSKTEIKTLKSDLDKSDPLEPEMILKVRNSLGLSQEQFGERVGAARRTIQDWEHGARSCKGSARMMVIGQADLIGKTEES
jgi:DNA-binding transcriptional regulator YiaG